MSKFTKYLLYVLFAASLVFIIGFFVNQDAMLDSFLYFAYILVAIALLAAFVLPMFTLLSNPKGLKKMLLFLLLAVVLIGLSYALASSDPLVVKIDIESSKNVLKLTDAGLILTYILSAFAFLSILLGGVVKMVRNR